MNRIDDLINEALSDEDQALLDRFGKEPGYFRQAFGLFRGRLGWVMWVVGIVQFVLFLAALYAFWQMLTADALENIVRWGIGAAVFVQVSTFLRGFMGMHFQANRVLRECQRIELRLVRLEDGSRE